MRIDFSHMIFVVFYRNMVYTNRVIGCFCMTTNIQKWGNSQGIRLPKHLLEAIKWHENEEVEIIWSAPIYLVQIFLQISVTAKSHFLFKSLTTLCNCAKVYYVIHMETCACEFYDNLNRKFYLQEV